MPRDHAESSAAEARRQARIALGKDPDDLSDVYRGRPTRPKKLKPIEPPVRYVPPAPLSLVDAASQLGIHAVQLAQAIREGKVATVAGHRCGPARRVADGAHHSSPPGRACPTCTGSRSPSS